MNPAFSYRRNSTLWAVATHHLMTSTKSFACFEAKRFPVDDAISAIHIEACNRAISLYHCENAVLNYERNY